MSRRLFARAPRMSIAFPLGFRRARGIAIELRAPQVLARQRALVPSDLLDRPLGDDFAPVNAGAGTEVDDVIRRFDRLLVVLDHDHRVAELA